MFSGRLTHAAIRALDWLAAHTLTPEKMPAHQRTGRRGEEAAYFHLRKLGYVMVARNFRSPRRRGEIDLIAWHKDILCFIEVKTRTSRSIKPAEAAVDRDKQHQLKLVAREYLRQLPPACPSRFDVVSVYYDTATGDPQFELFQNVRSEA
jgi:putative endonuclease